MTSYNVAITVGPNIFRPRHHKKDDLLNVGVFYDAMLRMIEHYSTVFDEPLPMGLNLNHGKVGFNTADRRMANLLNLEPVERNAGSSTS